MPDECPGSGNGRLSRGLGQAVFRSRDLCGTMRLIFAGSGSFAVPVLDRLLASSHELALVLTQPERPGGRGRCLRPTPVGVVAAAAGLPLVASSALAAPGVSAALRSADTLVVADYGRILPANLLDLPHYGGINVHPSVLPRWRGAAPVERAILAGDPETGVAIMRMEAGLDTGPIYALDRTRIGPEEIAGALTARLAERGATLLCLVLEALERGEARAVGQQGEATYAPRLEKSEARLDFTLDAADLARRVRAFNPRPLAWCEAGGERLRLLGARAIDASVHDPVGTIVAVGAEGLDVATGRGLLRVREMQRAGRRPQLAIRVARGWKWQGLRLA